MIREVEGEGVAGRSWEGGGKAVGRWWEGGAHLPPAFNDEAAQENIDNQLSLFYLTSGLAKVSVSDRPNPKF